MNLVLLLLLFHLCSMETMWLTPPVANTEKSTEAHSVSYQIKLINKGNKDYMRVRIIPEPMDSQVKVFIGNGDEDPGMRNSLFKCLQKPCYMWIPMYYYSNAYLLSMHIDCNTNCHYHYSIDYFDSMTIEDNSYFLTEITGESNVEIVYPMAQSMSKFMLFITSAGYGDIEVLLSNKSNNDKEIYFKMEPILFNGFGIVLEDKAAIEGKRYIMKIIVVRPTIITVGHKHLSKENKASVYLTKSEYSILNYQLNHVSECYSVSIPRSGETKQSSFALNAKSATNNAHIYIQNSRTKEVIISKDIIDSDILIFSYEQINDNSLCFKRMDKNNNPYVSLQFQLLDLNALIPSQPWVTPLDRGVLTKGYLPRNNILYYRLLKYIKPYHAELKTYLKIQLQVIKGNPVLYHYHCDEYPYCQVKPDDMQSIAHQLSQARKINDNYYHSINVSDTNPYNSVIQDTALVYCPDDSECLYNVLMQNDYEDNTMLFDNTAISTYISQSQTGSYSFEINNPDITGIRIELYSFIGKAAFTVIKAFPTNDNGKYMYDGTKEVYLLSSDDGGSIRGTFVIKVKGITNAFYSIYYSTKTRDSMFKENIIKANEIMLTTINNKEKSKTVSFTNQIANSDSVISIASMNCNVRIKYKKEQYTERNNQILIRSKEIEKHAIDIELISLDTQSTAENENCLVYSIVNESSSTDQRQRLLLSEGIKHTMQLTDRFNTINYVYPFYLNINSVDKESVMIIINKQSAGKLSLTYNLNSNPSTSLDLLMIQNRKIVIQQPVIKKQCQVNDICCLFVQIKSPLSSAMYPIQYAITIINSHQIPIYLHQNSIITNSLFSNKKYQYYYSDIGYNKQGEIKFHLIKGQGNAIAKIVAKDTQEDNPNWEKRIKLPVKKDKDLLQYNYYDNKITFTTEDTKKCQAAGCEVYIGVYPNSHIANESPEYLLSIKENQSVLNLELNTYTYGLLSKEEGQFYSVYIPIDSKKLIVEFINQFGLCYIKLGKEKPSHEDYTWLMNGNDNLMEISQSDKTESLKGSYLTFGLFSSIESKYDLNYKFKVTLNQKDSIDIIEGKAGENLRCKTKEDRCYFSIPINSHDNVIDVALYAYNEDVLSNTITIYSAFFDGDKYEKLFAEELKQKLPNEKQSDYSSKAQFDSDYLIIHFTPQGEEVINGYLLITVVSKEKGRLILMSSINKASLSIDLKSEDCQLIYLDEDSDMKLHLMGNDDTYSVNFKRVDGFGTIMNNIKERSYIMGEKQLEVTMILKPTNDSPIQISVVTKEKTHFLFIIQYTLRPEVNIDYVPYGKTIFIENQKKTTFPLAYYFPIKNKENDITVNFSYEAYELGHELNLGNQEFIMEAFITDEKTINQLKNKPSLLLSSLNAIDIGYKLETSYDYGLQIGVFSVRTDEIEKYILTANKYIYFTITPSSENKNEYDYFTSKIYVSLSSLTSIPLRLQPNRFYFSKLINQNSHLIKMTKRKENDSLMEISIALSTDKIIYTVNVFEDDLGVVDYEKNNTSLIVSEEAMNGFSKIVIDLTKATPGVLLSIFKLTHDEEQVIGNFAVEYITYSTPISHLTFLNKPTYNVTQHSFEISFDTAVNDKLEPALANYALKLYKKSIHTEVLNRTNSFYTHIKPDAIYSLNKVLTSNVTFKGEFAFADEYYYSIVTRSIIRRNDFFIHEYFAFPIYLHENHEIDPRPSNMWIYISGGVGIVVLSIGIVLLIFCCIANKNKHKRSNTDVDYEKITNAVDNIGL